MKKRSDTDWANPPEPVIHCQVTLRPHAPAGVALLDPSVGLVVRGTATSKKAPALGLVSLIYYVRSACLRWPVFREELQAMLAALPVPE